MLGTGGTCDLPKSVKEQHTPVTIAYLTPKRFNTQVTVGMLFFFTNLTRFWDIMLLSTKKSHHHSYVQSEWVLFDFLEASPYP